MSIDPIPKDLFVSQGKIIEAVFQQAVQQALLAHKRTGNSIVVLRRGQVIWIPAEQITVEETSRA